MSGKHLFCEEWTVVNIESKAFLKKDDGPVGWLNALFESASRG